MKPTERTIVKAPTTRLRLPRQAAVELPTESPLLIARVKEIDIPTGIIGLCVGYERGEWRTQQLVDHMFEHLPDFALKYSEYEMSARRNPIRLTKAIAKAIYDSDKFEDRGEFGELLLHIAIKQECGTIPAVSKIYYKSADNVPVHGFDAVHVVPNRNRLELWLGESKLYSNISAAITAVVAELHKHTKTNYLRREFAAITNKIDDNWPHADKLRKLLDPNTTLDDVFDVLCVPVLLTYDSRTVNSHNRVTEEYRVAFAQEIRQHFATFKSKTLPDIRIQLFLVPLKSKAELVAALDEKLKIWQKL